MTRAASIAHLESLGFTADRLHPCVWRRGPVTARWISPVWLVDHAALAPEYRQQATAAPVALARLRRCIAELAGDVP